MTQKNAHPHPSAGPELRLESSFVRHALVLEAATTFIQKKTGLGKLGCTEKSRLRERDLLARQLVKYTLELPAAQAALESPTPAKALEPHFESLLGAVVLKRFEQDQTARWLICDALIRKLLHASNRNPDSWNERSEAGDRIHAACGKALADLEGGAYPMRAFQDARAKGGKETHDFWAYLYRSASQKTSGAFRAKAIKLKFWEKADSLDAPSSDEDERRPELPDNTGSPERALRRIERRKGREQTIEILMGLARERAFPQPGGGKTRDPDPNAEIVLKFLEWLKRQGDAIREGAQSQFAAEEGIPTGTVNSAIHRFRERYGFKKDSRVLRELFLYTTHGGSHP